MIDGARGGAASLGGEWTAGGRASTTVRLPPSTSCARRLESGTRPGQRVPLSPPLPPPTLTDQIEHAAAEPEAGTGSLYRATQEKTRGDRAPGHPSSCRGVASVATVLRPAASALWKVY